MGKKGFAPYEEGLQQLDAGGVSAFTHLISVCYRFGKCKGKLMNILEVFSSLYNLDFELRGWSQNSTEKKS